ncbi:hypothetical protein COCNU_12G000030 [Cocos nucifera]|uniref:Uncharacterized protein n=1 Tax=Cocos nucifera TaxID=13894 RepID=A0A8K0IQR2_COCNU|nr:hypothetical protein COCNU_12G000030 [Cocos nucifera]
MPIQAVPTPETIVVASSSILPDDTDAPAPPEQEKVAEKKRKKVRNSIIKKVKRKLGHYLLAHSKVADLYQAEVSRALQEAQAKIEKAALTLFKDKRNKVEEKVDVEKEWTVEAFKSSKAMEDIKIAFVRKAFLEGFEICMRRVVKNFLDVDLNILMDELDEEVDPSNTGATSFAANLPLKFLNLQSQPLNPLLNLRILPVLEIMTHHLQSRMSHYLRVFL